MMMRNQMMGGMGMGAPMYQPPQNLINQQKEHALMTEAQEAAQAD